MSLFRYKVAISNEDEQCFSVNNLYATIYNGDLDLEYDCNYMDELTERGEDSYELERGTPICYVLQWTGPSTPERNAPIDELSDMAEHKRTPWRLSNITIDRFGGVSFLFDLACPFDNPAERSNSYHLYANNAESFSIIFETRSDSFARSRYEILRYRDTNCRKRAETIVRVTERTGIFLRRLTFHFPDAEEAYCDVAEYRR